MKHEKLRRHRVKQSVNLVELIRNRPRNQPYGFHRSSCSTRRNLRSRDNVIVDRRFRSSSLSHNQNQSFLPIHNQQEVKVFGRDSYSSTSTVCNSRKNSIGSICEECHQRINSPPNQEHTVPEPEAQATTLPCGFVNGLCRASTKDLNETKFCQEKNEDAKPSCINGTQFKCEKQCSDVCRKEFLVQPNKIQSSGNDNNSPKLCQHSSAAFNFFDSNGSDEVCSINEESATGNTPNNSRSTLQNQANTLFIEHASSRQILTDEEAGGDGHHNNSVIEIEITLHSSNDNNSEEEVEGDEDEHMEFSE
ncbi:uncharacterized protein LOC128863705 [Anastrepha ludens]|uniref:uncharacterized protein LOC128863705 n=1 Tax=Anastrepha ludens TaxID=28586 RepID=UPI0023AFD0F6|nr:uncharacterized protein LOC128863705 [Anastrepha ludens]